MLFSPASKTESTRHDSRSDLMLGVEQEFDLLDRDGQVDFRTLFARAMSRARAVPFRNSDSAAILEAGYMLGCDGMEAEFATAPISLRGAGPLGLAREVTRCRIHMLQLLRGLGVREVRGYSTHLSISVPAGREREVAEAISVTVAPALILLMEAKSSPGMLLRTRRGRLEIGSEYIDDERQLAAAAVFLAGAVHAFLFNENRWAQFPRVQLRRWEEANIRAGIYLPRDAYGECLHDQGRLANLELENGGMLPAGAMLERCTGLIACELEGLVEEEAIEALRQVAHQAGTFQIERDSDPGHIASRSTHNPVPESRTLTMLARGGGRRLRPRFVDWDGAAFAWRHAGHELVLGVPWAHLPALFTAAQHNRVNDLIPGGKAAEPLLNSLDQLQSPQTFQAVDATSLGSQAVGDKGTGGGKGAGGGKGGVSKPPAQLSDSRRYVPRPRFPWVPVILISVLLIGGGTFIGTRLTRRPLPTPTSAPLQGVPALQDAPDEPACLPSPALTYPPSAASLPTDVYTLTWEGSDPLPPGNHFVVLASSDPTAVSGAGDPESATIGKTSENSMLVDFGAWRYRGNFGEFFWTVRIQDANGELVDCGDGRPGVFSLVPADQAKREKEGAACDPNGMVGCP